MPTPVDAPTRGGARSGRAWRELRRGAVHGRSSIEQLFGTPGEPDSVEPGQLDVLDLLDAPRRLADERSRRRAARRPVDGHPDAAADGGGRPGPARARRPATAASSRCSSPTRGGGCTPSSRRVAPTILDAGPRRRSTPTSATSSSTCSTASSSSLDDVRRPGRPRPRPASRGSVGRRGRPRDVRRPGDAVRAAAVLGRPAHDAQPGRRRGPRPGHLPAGLPRASAASPRAPTCGRGCSAS